MELTDVELELFEMAYLLHIPLHVMLDMPYDEFLGWCEYFKKRPPGYKEDYRSFMIMQSFGAIKVKPEEIFPSLTPQKTAADKFVGLFSFLGKSKDGEKLALKDTK